VRVRQQLTLPTLCELVFQQPPGPLPAPEEMPAGRSLRLLVQGHDVPLFQGEITAITWEFGPQRERTLRVRGYDPLHHLRRRRSPQAHLQTTIQELAQDLVADLGLSVQAAHPGPLHQRILQHHRTDLQLLVDLAAQVGLYPTVRGSTLHLLPLTGDDALLSLEWGRDLMEARFDLNAEPAHPHVQVTGWHPLQVNVHDAEIDGPLPQDVASWLHGAAPQPQHPTGYLLESPAHAEAVAQALLERYQALELVLWGVALGDPRLRPGSTVRISGEHIPEFSPRTITQATHILDHQGGYVTHFNTQPPAPPASSPPAAALGVITRVDDPQNLGRVQAILPGYADLETDWMHVMMLAAGPDKGLMALPDVGDRVLILLPYGDLAQGFVLGGLYGMDGPPENSVQRGRVQRYTFRTPSGQRIQLDETTHTLVLEDAQGNRVQLSPQGVHLRAAGDMLLEAPGRDITIRGQHIDFQKA